MFAVAALVGLVIFVEGIVLLAVYAAGRAAGYRACNAFWRSTNSRIGKIYEDSATELRVACGRVAGDLARERALNAGLRERLQQAEACLTALAQRGARPAS